MTIMENVGGIWSKDIINFPIGGNESIFLWETNNRFSNKQLWIHLLEWISSSEDKIKMLRIQFLESCVVGSECRGRARSDVTIIN
jgi:hypothetical protein